MSAPRLTGFDHIVLCVADIARTCDFYRRALGMRPREERPGKWSLDFGASKISLQSAETAPDIAEDTVPGSGNFCVLTDTPLSEVQAHLESEDIAIVKGPGERDGGAGLIVSIYFNDPDGNLVEVGSLVSAR